MTQILEYLSSMGNVFSIFITAAVTWAGSFLFYRQKRDSLDIENEAKQSEEWRKLYLDSQGDSQKKDQKIDELRKEMQNMRDQHSKEMEGMRMRMINLERRVQLNTIYRCDKLDCLMRYAAELKHEETESVPAENA